MAEGSALRSLLAYFKIQVDDSELKKANSAVDAFSGRLKTVLKTAAVAFVVKGFKDFVDDQIQAANTLRVTADRLGVTTDEMQGLQLVAQTAGVPVEALNNGLRFLNRHLGEIALGKGKQAGTELNRLGVAALGVDGKARPAVDVMADLADKISAIPNTAEKTETAMVLLGRGGAQLIPVLEMGGKAFRDAAKEMGLFGGGMSRDFIKAANEVRISGVWLDFVMTKLKSTIVEALLPGIKNNYEWFMRMARVAIDYGRNTTWLASTIFALKAVLVSLAVVWAAANLPILAGIAAVTALYVIFDDFYAFLNGNASVIGDTLDHFFGLGTAVTVANDLKESFSAMIEVVKVVGEEILADVVTPLKYANALLRGDNKGAQKIADDAAAGGADRAARLSDAFTLTADQRDKKYQRGKYAGNSEQAQWLRGEFEGPPRSPDEEGGGTATAPTTRKTIWGDKVPVQYQTRSTPATTTTTKTAPVINQKNTYHIEVDAKGASNPKAIGDATGRGVSTEQQRSNSAAFAVTNQP